MSKPFIILDNSMTMHGVRFLVSGGRWERFKANPIMLYMHVRGEVFGKWNNLRFEENKWIADPEFDSKDPKVAPIEGKVKRGYLNACSPGVAIHAVDKIDGEIVVTDWEPYEVSIVDAGSNANSLQLYTPSGEMVKDSESYIKNLTLSIMSKETKTAGELAKEIIEKEVFPKAIALAAGLGEDATAETVADKIKTILDENKDLKLAVEKGQKDRVKSLVDAAFDAKKIVDGDREHYMKLGALDFDTTKAILDKIPAPENLRQFANDGGKQPSKEDDVVEYDRLFKAGQLAALKADEPEKFKRLFKAQFGFDPE